MVRMYSVVSGCCCKEVYRYPHNNYYFSLLHLYCIALFWGSTYIRQHNYAVDSPILVLFIILNIIIFYWNLHCY